MLRGLGLWLLAGILVPASFLGLAQLEGGVWTAPHVVVLFWPSSIILMATDGFELTAFSLWMHLVSIGANVALYAGIGVLVRFLRGRARTQPPGTPS
jgi:hypothetical protein